MTKILVDRSTLVVRIQRSAINIRTNGMNSIYVFNKSWIFANTTFYIVIHIKVMNSISLAIAQQPLFKFSLSG